MTTSAMLADDRNQIRPDRTGEQCRQRHQHRKSERIRRRNAAAIGGRHVTQRRGDIERIHDRKPRGDRLRLDQLSTANQLARADVAVAVRSTADRREVHDAVARRTQDGGEDRDASGTPHGIGGSRPSRWSARVPHHTRMTASTAVATSGRIQSCSWMAMLKRLTVNPEEVASTAVRARPHAMTGSSTRMVTSSTCRERARSNRIDRGYLQTKLLASSVLPLPWYVATCGYGHSGRVRTTLPCSTRDAITSFGAWPRSTQRRMTPSMSKVSVPGPPLHSIIPGTM